MTTYVVWKLMPDGTEEQLDFCTNYAKAIYIGMVEARKWWRVLKLQTKPRKPERIPTHIVVKQSGSSIHVIEVWTNRPPQV